MAPLFYLTSTPKAYIIIRLFLFYLKDPKRLITGDRIRASQMLVIDEEGNRLGVLTREEALKEAEDRELDLALISPTSRPPVAKIIEYGKYMFEAKRAAKKAAAKTRTAEIKGIRIGLRTGTHDLDIRLKQAQQFLTKGHKVRVVLMFRGREAMHQDIGQEKIQRFADELTDSAKVEQAVRRQGHQLILLLAPKK